MNQIKHKELSAQFVSATVTHENKLKRVHYSVKHETVLPPQKEDYHPISTDIENDQISFRISAERDKKLIKPLVSLSFEAL